MVRPQDSQSCNPGSIPGTTTKKASEFPEAFSILCHHETYSKGRGFFTFSGNRAKSMTSLIVFT